MGSRSSRHPQLIVFIWCLTLKLWAGFNKKGIKKLAHLATSVCRAFPLLFYSLPFSAPPLLSLLSGFDLEVERHKCLTKKDMVGGDAVSATTFLLANYPHPLYHILINSPTVYILYETKAAVWPSRAITRGDTSYERLLMWSCDGAEAIKKPPHSLRPHVSVLTSPS